VKRLLLFGLFLIVAALACTIGDVLPPTSTLPVITIPPSGGTLPGITPDLASDPSVCTTAPKSVALIVDPSLYGGISANLTQFEVDLCAAGYRIIEYLSDFANPDEVRNYLINLYNTETSQPLAGFFLIGDIPHAYQWVTLTSANPSIPDLNEEVISYQFYSDLNGSFGQSPSYTSPGGHSYSYDLHSGDLNWEIWVGVLPLYKGDIALTIDAINRYFQKNHTYRTGGYSLPRAFLQINEHRTATTPAEHTSAMNDMTSGQYAWTPFSSDPTAQIYFNSTSAGLTVEQGYTALSNGVADFTVGDAHGYWGGHGLLDIAWAESNPIQTIFFWSNGCAVGNLDQPDNFLTSVLYSPTSLVLLAKGTTNDSGGMGTNSDGFFGHNIATALSAGASLGDAVLAHVNVPLISPWSSSREFHTATTILLGDPTLILPP